MLSYLIHGDAEAAVTGLKAFDPEDRPPVNIVFQSYHLMVGIGMLLILLSVVGVIGWWRGWLFRIRWLLWVFVFAVFLPQLANQLGWLSAEVGRQPWVVYGLMRTADGLSASVTATDVIISLVMFGLIYLLLFVLFIYLLNDKITKGPAEVAQEPAPGRAEG
jgi:cytochrome d ubiquinol oxidase subunit I